MTDTDHVALVLMDAVPEHNEETLQAAQDRYERSIGWGVD